MPSPQPGARTPGLPGWYKFGLRGCALAGVVLGLVLGHGDLGKSLVLVLVFQVVGNLLFAGVVAGVVARRRTAD